MHIEQLTSGAVLFDSLVAPKLILREPEGDYYMITLEGAERRDLVAIVKKHGERALPVAAGSSAAFPYAINRANWMIPAASSFQLAGSPELRLICTQTFFDAAVEAGFKLVVHAGGGIHLFKRVSDKKIIVTNDLSEGETDDGILSATAADWRMSVVEEVAGAHASIFVEGRAIHILRPGTLVECDRVSDDLAVLDFNVLFASLPADGSDLLIDTPEEALRFSRHPEFN